MNPKKSNSKITKHCKTHQTQRRKKNLNRAHRKLSPFMRLFQDYCFSKQLWELNKLQGSPSCQRRFITEGRSLKKQRRTSLACYDPRSAHTDSLTHPLRYPGLTHPALTPNNKQWNTSQWYFKHIRARPPTFWYVNLKAERLWSAGSHLRGECN